MKLFDYVALGLRNIWRRKSRSFLTILAVIIGTISIVIMLSLVLGAKQIATRQLESIDGFTLISVSPNPEVQSNGDLLSSNQNFDDSGQKLNDTHVAELKQISHVIDAAPIVNVWAKNIKLEGQDKRYYANVVAYTLGTKVLNIPVSVGRQLKEDDMDKIVIGNEFLREYGYANHPNDIIGKKVILYMPDYVDWGTEPQQPPVDANESYWEDLQRQPHEVTAEIIGVVTTGPDNGQNYITLNWGKRLMTSVSWKGDDAGKKQYDEQRNNLEQLRMQLEDQKKQIYAHLLLNDMTKEERDSMMQKLTSKIDQNISDIQSQLDIINKNMTFSQTLFKQDNIVRDGYSSILVRADNTDNVEEIGKEIKKLGFGVQTAKDMLDQIKNIFTLVGMIIGAIGGIVLFVAALGIINNMIMATYERTREIGILRACGATRANIRNMFIFEAATLGFLGGVIGLIVSFGLAKILNAIGNGIAVSQSIPITNIISFPLWLIVGVIALTTIIGTLSGLLPAIRASYLDPVEALRYE